MFLADLRDELSQGDVFRTLPVVDRRPNGTRERDVSAVVLSHDCEIDKPESRFVLVVGIQPGDRIAPDRLGLVRAGRIRSAMHFPGSGPLAEGFIDFRRLYRVHRDFVDNAMTAGERVASMTDEARDALIAFTMRFFSREVFIRNP